ncbi:GAF domain-containing protein [Deinococcus sp. QL22]|uniref:GAF domain-containing protein n=1 Tax=Deinococcus sp. QL22 TaxID=2939437 RepID=UPI00201807EC|nr:GAF domain-containing protein [Deinococcus sp. QL22]UQN05407.1 GAF domain-containing protein [Deinococcus sp. QL22]
MSSHPVGSALSFSDRLQAVTEALAAHTPEDLLGMFLTPALEGLGAIASAALLVDDTGQRLRLAAAQGFEAGAQTIWQDASLDEHMPAGDALARQKPLFFEHQGALLQAYPDLEERTGGVAAVATAVLPMMLEGRPLGALILDFQEPHQFTQAEIAFLRTLAAQCAVALERAQLQQHLEARVAARTAELEEERAALDAFVAYKESVGTESDVRVLAHQAVRVVHANLQHVSAAYYELEDGLWKARVWSEDMPPEIAEEIQAGVPEDAPDFSEAARSRAPVFVDGWDAEANGLPGTTAYGAVAFLPLIINGKTHSLFAVGIREARAWLEREKALARAVARGLTITLERTEATRQLQVQNAELDIRTRALEGFAELTRDLALEDDAVTLVGRAQELVVSLLPGSVSTYYEPDGETWRLLSHRGEFQNPALLRALGRGLPRGSTLNVDQAFETRQPYYQDQHDPNSVAAAREEIRVIRASVAFPVFDGDTPRGVMAVGLHQAHRWTSVEGVLLDTILRSLALALERAKQTWALQQRTAELVQANEELRRSNRELEQFAYIASHDLQAPIRAVTSFAGAINKRYGDKLDERGRLYLQQIVEGGEHMKRLVDDLLTFSRVHTQQGKLVPVDAQTVFDTVARRLHTPEATLIRSALPVVQADAQQLDQLLQNLISNGLKYRREGVVPEVQVSAEREGAFWRFAVSDNGIGIEAQYYERIFEIFQRLHGRESYEGTGIGLAVCKKIVERHGGQLWLESTPGQGSTFFFTFPEALATPGQLGA